MSNSNIVTTGYLGMAASMLTKKLGRRVVVHRVSTILSIPGRKGSQKTQIRYSLGVEGSNPPVFFGMMVNECKGRMAMILDLLMSGVIHANAKSVEAVQLGASDDQEKHISASDDVGDQFPRSGDRY